MGGAGGLLGVWCAARSSDRARVGECGARARVGAGYIQTGVAAGAGFAAGGGALGLPAVGALASASRSLAFTGEGRAFRPRRCALPITALRLTPPSSSAICEAVEPPSHILVSFSMRSSVQLIVFPNLGVPNSGLGQIPA